MSWVINWPSLTHQHSAMVAKTLDDADFAEFDDAHTRLKALRRRHETFMILIRAASAF
jgi:hypothetical protein